MRSKQELDAAIRRERRAALVVNARSRRGRRLYEEARTRLVAAGFTLLGTYPADRPGELETSLATAAGLGPDLLAVGGGDGTIGAAARLLAHRDIALGLLPLGTTNNFARTVGIPLDLDAAVATLADGKVIDVDLGTADGMPFANHVGVGLSADVMARVPARLKRVVGRLAYPATALALLTGHRPMRITVQADGRSREYLTHQLFVANGGFHAGRPITADANADDRLLVAYPVGGPTRRDLLGATARNAATGHRRTLDDEPFLTAGEILLRTDRPVPVEVDGEVRGRTPVRIGLAANALRVMAPADAPDR
ncbi:MULTISPECIES: diacylglycerol kinase family protein [unclassified Plantactinospora]|uniref:diacylglycerol/lipid kinase family protein n=1 Tax=unclassified Plantactinospora TaxID=2631981 RepID=UPI000D17E4CF|nr:MULTISPECIES: diacylglycerol kinase family protein [unclassified Plantactinospora]AVT28245.1 diacylglycerol kinase [Plantactinospora sp. BC1]AVT38521.1 diacylglycerol kinase [Plantactinospora sp. BB1]